MQTTPDVLRALDYLYNTREMQVFRAWLSEMATNEMLKAISDNENPDVTRGRAQMVLELHNIIEQAPTSLQRLETRKNGTKQQDQAWHP